MSALKMRLLAKWLKRDTVLDEKSLIVEKEKKATITDNGSITNERALFPETKMANDKGKSDAFENGSKDDGMDQMSFTRKICFFLSINVSALYVMFFAFILPCRNPFCEDFQKMWESNCSNGGLNSNFAIANLSEQLSVLIFADINNSSRGWYLEAFSMQNGERMWNTSLSFNPEIVHCEWRKTSFDANFDETDDCLVVGRDTLIAINASDGHIFWSKKLRESGRLKLINVIPRTNSTSNSKALALVFGENQASKAIKKIYLLVLNGSTGEILERIDAPCTGNKELAFMRRMAPSLKGVGDREWIIVCSSQNSTEA